MSYTPSKSTAAKIESLASAPDTVAADIIKEAIANREEQKRKAAVAQAESELRSVESTIQRGVAQLKEARAAAKRKEVKLGKLVDAQNAYLKTGDYNAFSEASSAVHYD